MLPLKGQHPVADAVTVQLVTSVFQCLVDTITLDIFVVGITFQPISSAPWNISLLKKLVFVNNQHFLVEQRDCHKTVRQVL